MITFSLANTSGKQEDLDKEPEIGLLGDYFPALCLHIKYH